MERSSTPAGTAGARRRRGRKPPPKELVERRRAEIIEAAFEVFSTRGYNASGIADIAERLGIGHGTFYRYFKNKRDILDQVVDYGVERMIVVLGEATAKPPETLDDFRTQLRDTGQRLFALLDAEPGLGRVVLLEATSVDQEMTHRVLSLIEMFGALGAAYLDDCVSRGFLRADLDTASVGRAITALVLPGLFAAVRGQSDDVDRSRYIEAMVSLVCEGIGTR